MAVVPIDKLDNPDEGGRVGEVSFAKEAHCASAGGGSSCQHCAKAMEQLNGNRDSYQPLPLGRVLLVFFLPLICAASLVIISIRCLPKLAEHPGYLALSALGVVCAVLLFAGIFTRPRKTPERG